MGPLQPRQLLTSPVRLLSPPTPSFPASLHPCWPLVLRFSPVYSLSPAREIWGGIFQLRRGPVLLAPPLMSLPPGNPGSLSSPPRVRRCGQLSSYLSGPQGMSCRLLPTSGAMMMAEQPVPHSFPWPRRTPAWLGQGDSESGIWGCGHVCTLPDAPRHLPPGCCARLPLLLGVSAPEPSDALPHTGGPGLSCRSGKEAYTSGGFSVTPCLHPASGRSVSGLGVQDPSFGLVTGLQLSSPTPRGVPQPPALLRGPGQHRDQAGERLAPCHAGAPREVGRVTATGKEPCRPQGSVWGRVLSSCRGWTGAAVARAAALGAAEGRALCQALPPGGARHSS